MKHIKISASEIASLIVYGPLRNFSYTNQEKMDIGRYAHLKFGFTNVKKFTRFIVIDDYLVEITGYPDRIDYNNATIEELKTFNRRDLSKQEKAGIIQLQIYLFLTGMTKGKIYLFNVEGEKITKRLEIEYDENQIIDYIKKAITIKLALQNLL